MWGHWLWSLKCGGIGCGVLSVGALVVDYEVEGIGCGVLSVGALVVEYEVLLVW